jgi:peptidoglycan/LPS O-acetylase OafA/YrhL
MFFSLLLVTLLIAVAVAFFTVRLFDKPIESILRRIVAEELSSAWHRYIKFAAYVVGVSGGVRVFELERYISPGFRGELEVPLVLTAERWTLEVYRTVISTLQSIAWMLLIVFIVALVAFVIVRGFELKAGRREQA